MDILQDDRVRHLGGLADSVRDVLELDAATIVPPPGMTAAGGNRDWLRGIARRGDQFLLVLDVNRMFATAVPDAVSGGADMATAPLAPAAGTRTGV
jgi:purine-binding chemotaxis protein CheW